MRTCRAAVASPPPGRHRKRRWPPRSPPSPRRTGKSPGARGTQRRGRAARGRGPGGGGGRVRPTPTSRPREGTAPGQLAPARTPRSGDGGRSPGVPAGRHPEAFADAVHRPVLAAGDLRLEPGDQLGACGVAAAPLMRAGARGRRRGGGRRTLERCQPPGSASRGLRTDAAPPGFWLPRKSAHRPHQWSPGGQRDAPVCAGSHVAHVQVFLATRPWLIPRAELHGQPSAIRLFSGSSGRPHPRQASQSVYVSSSSPG